VQAVARAQDLDPRDLLLRRLFQPRSEAWRKGKAAPIGQFDDHAPAAAVKPRRGSTRLGLAGDPASVQGGIDLVICQHGRVSPPTWPATGVVAPSQTASFGMVAPGISWQIGRCYDMLVSLDCRDI
jgi:hypothetical protein